MIYFTELYVTLVTKTSKIIKRSLYCTYSNNKGGLILKKRMSVGVFLLLFLLAGCGAETEWKVEITKPLHYVSGQESSFEIKITEAKKPVTGVSATARIEMAGMDHGALNFRLKEGDKGHYSGNAMPTMSGKYSVSLKLKKDGRTYERLLEMDVEK